jgi:hypothetical protein
MINFMVQVMKIISSLQPNEQAMFKNEVYKKAIDYLKK